MNPQMFWENWLTTLLPLLLAVSIARARLAFQLELRTRATIDC